MDLSNLGVGIAFSSLYYILIYNGLKLDFIAYLFVIGLADPLLSEIGCILVFLQ